MSRRGLLGIIFEPQRLVHKKLRKPTGAKPGKGAVIVEPTKRKASISVQTVPAKIGRLRWNPRHRLDGIPNEFMNMSDITNHECIVSASLRTVRPKFMLPSVSRILQIAATGSSSPVC